jgi:hypothetical protein
MVSEDKDQVEDNFKSLIYLKSQNVILGLELILDKIKAKMLFRNPFFLNIVLNIVGTDRILLFVKQSAESIPIVIYSEKKGSKFIMDAKFHTFFKDESNIVNADLQGIGSQHQGCA